MVAFKRRSSIASSSSCRSSLWYKHPIQFDYSELDKNQRGNYVPAETPDTTTLPCQRIMPASVSESIVDFQLLLGTTARLVVKLLLSSPLAL